VIGQIDYHGINDCTYKENKKMRKNKLIILIAVMAVMLISLQSYAQGVDKIAQTGMKWLDIPIGARPASLGNAYMAGAPDASSVFWNPAATALVTGTHVFLSQTQWIADINVLAASGTYEVPDIGTFGVHFMNVSWGTIRATQFNGQATLYDEMGTFEPTDFAIGITYAKQISAKFSVGSNVRYIHENLLGDFVGAEGSMANPEEVRAQMDNIAIDLATLFYTGYKDLRFGVSVKNLSTEKAYRFETFPLPLTFTFGIAMDLAQAYFLEQGSPQSLTLLVDAVHPRDFSERVHVGLEYSYDKMFFLRGGYKTNQDEQGLTLGGGIDVEISDFSLGVDYSYLDFGNFDAVHIFSFDFGF
jgi:opacity protein-like surface antigen